MGDPRLNSIHLDGSNRRDLYRQARERLLDSRGYQTLIIEKQEEAEIDRPDTMIQEPPGAAPGEELVFWLQDQDSCIYPLKVGINTVGRAEDNDVVLNDSFVSRRHCAVLIHAGKGCELHDTASKNGTYLNGNRINGPTRLKPGDEIRTCGKQLIFRSRFNPGERSSATMSISQ